MKRFILSIVTITVCCLFSAFSQTTTRTDTTNVPKNHVIELYDGSTYIGKILTRTMTNILIETNSKARIDIPISQIKSIIAIVPEKTWPNQLPNRYFLSQSAINLKKNEAYLKISSCYSLNPVLPFTFVTSFDYGFTDFFTVSAGIDAITIFNSKHPLFYLNPKFGFKVADKLYLGVGAYYANMGTNSDTLALGLGYGLITVGTPEHNVSLSGGIGHSYGEWVYKPTFTISGLTKVSKRLYLVTENWIAPIRNKEEHSFIDPKTYEETRWNTYKYVYNLYVSYGMRFVTGKYAVDLGFINNKNIFDVNVIGSPYMDFVIKF